MMFGRNKLSRRSTSMRKGLATEVYDPDDDPDYRNGEPHKWEMTTVRYKGTLNGQFKKEDVVGSITEAIETMKKQPAKYLAIKHVTSDVNLPETEQAFTYIYRKNAFGLSAHDPDPDGTFTLVTMDYERLPRFKDDILPKNQRDKFTDSMIWKGKQLHTAENKPLLPGRGMGVVDKPCLKVIGDVDPTDVKQGLIGDCWMLSGISTLAEYDGSIHRLFRKTKDVDKMPFDEKPNLYSISLYDLKTWKEVEVVVDERLCLRPDWRSRNGDKRLLGAKPSRDGQLWVPYLEKAITIHCGGFDQVNYGANCNHAWSVLTGVKEQCTIMRKGDETSNWGCYGKYNIRDKKWEELDNDPWKGSQAVFSVPWPEAGGGSFSDWKDYNEKTDDQLFQKMCEWDDNNFLLAASSKGESDQNKTDGIIDSHAYGIVDCRSNIEDSGVDLIQLRNPWGHDGALDNGMFVKDKGTGWEKYPRIKEELKPELDDPGVFWITKEEFFKYFGTFYLSGRDMSEFLGFPATANKKRKAEEAAIVSELPAKRKDDDEAGTGVTAGPDAVIGDDDAAGGSGVDHAFGDEYDDDDAGTVGDATGDIGGDATMGDNDETVTAGTGDAAGGSGGDATMDDNDETVTAGTGDAAGGSGGDATMGDTDPSAPPPPPPYVANPKIAARERRRKLQQCVLAVFCLAGLGAGLPFFIPFVLDLPPIIGGDTTPIVLINETSAPTLTPVVATSPPTTLPPTISPAPTLSPTVSPAPTITAKPTVVTPSPTISPSITPTERPTSAPTTLAPTVAPTTPAPTWTPTSSPTRLPTPGLPPPTLNPTEAPFTEFPTKSPTLAPTRNPTKSPTLSPTKNPTISPTGAPATPAPTKTPTTSPTRAPTKNPTSAPTRNPTKFPTRNPTASPTTSPPTKSPIVAPTKIPTKTPTKTPTASPTTSPPTKSPTSLPTKSPTRSPTGAPVTPAPTKSPIDVQLESISGEGAFDNPRSAQSAARNVLLREGLGSQGQFDERGLERYAAAVFYFSTEGDDYWYLCFRGHINCGSSQWFNGDVCSWQFISCNGDGFITSIVIGSDNGLRGSIPMEIWSLKYLEVLEIVDNPTMSGPLPTKFGETATNMVLMRVENSGLTGTIPNGFLTNSPLEFLYLSRNELSGTIPNSMGLLTSLNELTLHGNALTGAVPPPVCTLRGTGPSDLQVLTVDCNEVSCSCCSRCY